MTRTMTTSNNDNDTSAPKTITVHTSLLFDPTTKAFLPNRSITINPTTGLITALSTRPPQSLPTPNPLPATDIDLTHLPLIIPGLVDAHTHIFLHPYAEAPALIQMRDESPTERTIRAVNHVRQALLAGYTTYRDLGTEAMGDADLGVRDAINRGLIPGPRIYAATQAIASTGGYEVRGENPEVRLPAASDVADGVDGVRRAVRRRLGVGADVIKVYGDYRRRVMRFPPPLTPGGPDIEFPPTKKWPGSGGLIEDERNPVVCMWSQEEMNALVEEAKRANCPVAAHCGGNEAVQIACKAGVTSIEHGQEIDTETLLVMKECGVIFVPTLSVMEMYVKGTPVFEQMLQTTKRAWEMGIPLACGGDTGPFAHGENARELELMVQAGVPVEDVLVAATVGGWKSCGGVRGGGGEGWKASGASIGRTFGSFTPNCAADIVGLAGPIKANNISGLRAVDFVMKDGRVWKRDGRAVGMV